MTNSGVCASSAARASLELVTGKTSCPSARSISVTICTMVNSSSTRSTFAIEGRLMETPRNRQGGLVMRVDDVAHLEDGQEHADHDAAHHHAEEHDQNRLDQRGQAGQDRFDFLVEEVGYAFHHAVDLAGLLAGGEHADDHGREDRVLGE